MTSTITNAGLDDEDEDEICSPPQDFICPITQEIFRDPVQDLFGHTYERSAILAWISAKGTCPMTRKAMRASNLIPNCLMKTKVRLWQQEHHHHHHHHGQFHNNIYDEDTDHDSNDHRDTVLIGYLSMPDTSSSNVSSSLRSGGGRRRHRGRWGAANHRQRRRRGELSEDGTNASTERPVFVLGGDIDESRQNQRSLGDLRLERLLADYHRIVEQEQELHQDEGNRWSARTANGGMNALSHDATESTTLGRDVVGSSSTSSSSSENTNVVPAAAARGGGIRVRSFLFPRKRKNVNHLVGSMMTTSACS